MTNERNDFLKFLAAILMVIDHVGAVFFPHLLYLRVIGRPSFPIFAYYTALGAENTSNAKRYFGKMLIMGLITQPIYRALLPGQLNIFFTLVYGAVIVYLFRQKKIWFSLLAVCLLVASPLIDVIDYGEYGLLTILIFYLVGTDGLASCFFIQGLLQIANHFAGAHPIQALSLLALPFIYSKRLPYMSLPRHFFYLFYPLHLAVLLLIRML